MIWVLFVCLRGCGFCLSVVVVVVCRQVIAVGFEVLVTSCGSTRYMSRSYVFMLSISTLRLDIIIYAC